MSRCLSVQTGKKILFRGHMLLINEEEVFGTFSKKNCKKQIKKSLELKNQSRENVINCILNGKATILL